MRVLGLDVDVREEVVVHEGVVGFRVGGGEADVLILQGVILATCILIWYECLCCRDTWTLSRNYTGSAK